MVKDPELKELFFTGARALAGKRAAPSHAPGAVTDQWSRKKQKAAKKVAGDGDFKPGKGKGKG